MQYERGICTSLYVLLLPFCTYELSVICLTLYSETSRYGHQEFGGLYNFYYDALCFVPEPRTLVHAFLPQSVELTPLYVDCQKDLVHLTAEKLEFI